MLPLLALSVLLHAQNPDSARDSVYGTTALRDFIARAAVQNLAPPPQLIGYSAVVESELALILRDSLGRELVGQVEQVAARAQWERSGRYELHVVGFRAQMAFAEVSALTWTRMWTVPTLYGNRLRIGMNEGIAGVRDSARVISGRRARRGDTTQYVIVHPLAVTRDRYYRFTGGDTIAMLTTLGRVIHVVQVNVEPVADPRLEYGGFAGELDFDAERHQLVRMRGRIVSYSRRADPLLVRATGAVAVAFIEFENAEVNGKYWLPARQWSEFQAQMGAMGETRPIYRIISRFRDYTPAETTLVSSGSDSVPQPMAPTRARLTFAAKDSVSRYDGWDATIGVTTSSVSAAYFDDLAPDVWRHSGPPTVYRWPPRFEDVVRYNRAEGLFTGVGGAIRFRDAYPGLTARGTLGVAWAVPTVRGSAAVSLRRGAWTTAARAERTLANTNDFLLPLESGLSIAPLISGVDDNDYVDRWTAAVAATRVLGSVDRAIVSGEMAMVRDRPEVSRLEHAVFHRSGFRPVRNAFPGTYARWRSVLEYHPNITGTAMTAGVGARVSYEAAAGDLDWQRVEARLSGRRYWRSLVFASRLDGGAVFGSRLPPQVMYELGGGADLPAYEYKEFGGDRAAVARALATYTLPVLRRPIRVRTLMLPGISPGVGAGVAAGWAEASSDAARAALLALGGDGVTPLSRPTDGVRATADVRLTLLSGMLSFGFSRPLDHAEGWRPFFAMGTEF